MSAELRTPPRSAAWPSKSLEIPPLQAGDRLTRDEFLRRYEAMPHVNKAELIEGVVHMPSPVRADQHGEPHSELNGWLFYYKAYTPIVCTGENSTLLLDLDNTPQPDLYVRLLPEAGGQAKLGDDGYIDGAPELVAEIAASSVSYDLHDKKNAYRRNGVREYVVWRVQDGEVDWFVLRGGQFDQLPAGDDGVLRSQVLPGLWLDPRALVAGDTRKVLDVLKQGLDSDEHSRFVQQREQQA